MKKILAVMAALCVMALPVAGLAEEAAETPMTTQLQYALGNIELTVNGQALDFKGYEYDALLSLNPDGTILESVSNLVNDQIAFGGEALMESGVMTVALRGVDGVFLTPALSVNVNELMEQYLQMYAGQNGGADMEAMINQYMVKAMGVVGIVMNRLNQLKPEQTVIEGYAFCDGAVSDVAVNVYTLDPDTLNGIAADVTEALGVQSPISFDGVTLQVMGGGSAEGRNVFCLVLNSGEQSYSLEAQAFDANGGKTFYACVFAGDNAIADLLALYTIDGNLFNAQLAVNAAGSLAFTFGINGTVEESAFTGKISCSLEAPQASVSFLSDVYAAIAQVEYTGAGAELKALETVDLMALTQDEEAANALAQQWTPSLMDSINLIRQVPAFDMLLQAFLPSGETVAE